MKPTVSVSGTLIAGLLRESLQSGYSEGLIFGEVLQTTQEAFEDTKEGMLSTLEIVINSFVCTGKTAFSFYDKKGQITQSAMGDLVRGEPNSLIGWFAASSKEPTNPSIRQAAVHSNLRLANPGMPGYFLVVRAAQRPAQSTQIMTAQCFRQESGSLALRPAPFSVSSLTNDSASAYSSLRSAPHLAIPFGMTPPEQFPAPHIVQLERSLDRLMSDFDQALDNLESEEEKVSALRRENDKLKELAVKVHFKSLGTEGK